MAGGFPSSVKVASSQSCVFHKSMLFQRPTTDLYLARVISGWMAWEWVETFQLRSRPRKHSTDVCNDGHFVKRSISECVYLFTVAHVGTERVVLLHAALSNKGAIFLYTFQPLIFVLIKYYNG